jgi:Endosomal/lysosomal potassium channel TMEM175
LKIVATDQWAHMVSENVSDLAADAEEVLPRMKAPFSTGSDRLEAFSDGVIAVITTIMVLELKPPHGTDLPSLQSVAPTLPPTF